MNRFSKAKEKILTGIVTTSTVLMAATPVLAASGSEVQGKISKALQTIQGILTGIVVLAGVCVALWIIIKRMPDADDPREKSEVYHAVGRVAGLVALSAAVIWLLPWFYSLFS
ncbi:CagC family type IV secretion system protein [Liquorilactobacillus ghanensis]